METAQAHLLPLRLASHRLSLLHETVDQCRSVDTELHVVRPGSFLPVAPSDDLVSSEQAKLLFQFELNGQYSGELILANQEQTDLRQAELSCEQWT